MKITKPILASMAAALGSIGIMNIDRRPTIDTKGLKDLDESQYAKILKAGDIMVGAETTADESVAKFLKKKKDFISEFKQNRKNNSFSDSVRSAFYNTSTGSTPSKIIAPIASHVEYVQNPETSLFIGGKKNKIKDILKKKNMHFVVLRRKSDTDKGKVKNILKRDYFSHKKYNPSTALKSAVREAVFPNLRRSDRAKSDKDKRLEKDIVDGVCATLPTLVGDTTTGGKTSANVLPADYMKSTEWKPVGYFGTHPDDVKVSNKIIYEVPKAMAQGAVAGTIGMGTYGISKFVKHLRKVV